MNVNQFLVENPFLLFVTLWVFNSFLASIIGGWIRLSQFFDCERDFEGNWMTFQSGSVGFMRYGRCLWIGASSEGLWLKTGPLFVFRLFHTPLFIPWSAVRKVIRKKFLWYKNLVIEVEKPKVKLVLPISSLEDHSHFWTHLEECQMKISGVESEVLPR
jgi:hypothetical protein